MELIEIITFLVWFVPTVILVCGISILATIWIAKTIWDWILEILDC